MNITVGAHYESKIDFLKDKNGEIIVSKRYDNKVPCIRFLNTILKNHYDGNIGDIMPVAYHEFNILKNLEPFRIAPRPLAIDKDCIYMTYEGNPITGGCQELSRESFLWQAKNILHVLHRLGIRHNDMLDRNVLQKDGVIKLIDFTLSEYPGLDISSLLPDQNWALINQDYKLLTYADYFPENIPPAIKEERRKRYRKIASKVYNYHNLGVGIYDEAENEKTPYGYGERYNFDRMALMVASYDFTGKNVLDIGCNSGWFSFQSAMLGARKVLGIDYEIEGKMGQSVKYARAFAEFLEAPVKILDQNLDVVNLTWITHSLGIKKFDVSFVLSVLHHIKDKKYLMEQIYTNTRDVIFYEDHEFWNEIHDCDGYIIPVQGEGHRYGWNEDMSWQRKMASVESHEPLVLDAFLNSWRRTDLLLDKYSRISLLGFSEKRRPLLALFK